MEQSILVNGRMISKMEQGLRNGWMVRDTRESIKMVQRVERVSLNFWMEVTIKDNF